MMALLKRLWHGSLSDVTDGPEEESCANCRYADLYPDEPDDECNVYCTVDFVKGRLEANPYGGHWTHTRSWCREWEGGAPVWSHHEMVGAVKPNEKGA